MKFHWWIKKYIIKIQHFMFHICKKKYMFAYCDSFDLKIESKARTRSVPSPFLIPTNPFRNGSVFACCTACSSAAE